MRQVHDCSKAQEDRYAIELYSFDIIAVRVEMPRAIYWDKAARDRLMNPIIESVRQFEETCPYARTD